MWIRDQAELNSSYSISNHGLNQIVKIMDSINSSIHESLRKPFDSINSSTHDWINQHLIRSIHMIIGKHFSCCKNWKNKLLNVKTNLQKVTIHDGGVLVSRISCWCALNLPSPLGRWRPNALKLFTVYWRMPGTKVSQYSSLRKRGTRLYFRHNAQHINVQIAAIYYYLHTDHDI